jgi:hypothetical protein
MQDQTAAASAPQQSQQDCPLMRLPTELRNKIYEFSLQDTIDTLSAADEDKLDPVTLLPQAYKTIPFHCGAFALPHTSHTLRIESLDTLGRLMLARVEQVIIEFNHLRISGARNIEAAKSERSLAYRQAVVEDQKQAMKQTKSLVRLRYICHTMKWEGMMNQALMKWYTVGRAR